MRNISKASHRFPVITCQSGTRVIQFQAGKQAGKMFPAETVLYMATECDILMVFSNAA
jgi:hypothetical protein